MSPKMLRLVEDIGKINDNGWQRKFIHLNFPNSAQIFGESINKVNKQEPNF